MKEITGQIIIDALFENVPQIVTQVPEDIFLALKKASEVEKSQRAKVVLDQLIENANIAKQKKLPICQDTGTVWICLEIGSQVYVKGDVFSGVNKAIGEIYTQEKLRKSLVQDALFDRSNTNDNTPAFCELRFMKEPQNAQKAYLHIMVKGGGSDNASYVVMLNPSEGKQGIINAVIKRVKQKASSACPPLIVGLGIGTTFDKVASLSKRALMTPLGVQNPNYLAQKFEDELLDAINNLKIGAGALGGTTTALGVRVKTAPCHIAALPVAINLGCSAMRRKTIEL